MASSSVNIAALTEDQQIALQQFTSVTDQELDAALPLLQKCQWNAQIAITRFFDGDADTIDPIAEAARAPPPTARRTENLQDSIQQGFPTHGTSRNGLEPAPRVVPTPESQITQQAPFILSLVLLPFNITYNIFRRIFGAVGWAFPIIPRLLGRLYPSQASRSADRRPLNPRDTAARFLREFEEEYNVEPGTLPFHESGYAQAFDIAKRDLKYLLVILLSPEHDDTAPFVRDTLLSPEVVSFVKDKNNEIILWAGNLQDSEAYQVSNALNVTKLPFCGLIVHTPSVSSTAMSVVARIPGPATASDLLSKLREAITRRNDELRQARASRQEQQAARSIREEQNSAYERSLAQDRERTRQRREAEAAREKAEREERDVAEAKAQKARDVAAWKQWRVQSLPGEPESSVKDAVRISVRLPSGDRIVRRFAGDAEVEELYAFVECFEVLREQEEAGVSEKEVPEPTGYKHEYGFQLVSPMPREVYDVAKGGSLKTRIGRSGNLIVERLGEDDEDEDDDDDASV